MKISKISLNGRSIEVNDPNAAQLGENEFSHNDLPIFDEETNEFKGINKDDLVEVETKPRPNSTKLITSGGVYEAIENRTFVLKHVELIVEYVPLTQKLVFRYVWDSQTSNNLLRSVQLYVISINNSYNSDTEELKFSNIIDILTLSPGIGGNYTEKDIPTYTEDRVFYFLLINNYQHLQICNLNANYLLIPGSNTKINNQITVTSQNQGGDRTLTFIAQANVDIDVNCSARLVGVTDHSEDCIVYVLLEAGTSSATVQVPLASQNRLAFPAIVPQGTSENYNYILSTRSLDVDADLGRIEISVVPMRMNPIVQFQLGNRTAPRTPIDLRMICESSHGDIILTTTLNPGAQNVVLEYEHHDIVSNLARVEVGDRSHDGVNKYFIATDTVILITDPHGNPY